MLLGFRVDDSAARGGRLETLGLGSASVAAPLVALGRALVQFGVQSGLRCIEALLHVHGTQKSHATIA